MFGYLLSVAVAFVVIGTIVNVVKNFSTVFKKTKDVDLWVMITILSVFWFFTVPIATTISILYLLKLLVDLISKQVLKLVNRNKSI